MTRYENCCGKGCEKELYYEDDKNNQDDAWEIDDKIFCEECFIEYVLKEYYLKLQAS